MAGVSLNRPLSLEEAQRIPDGAGGFVESWVEIGVLWADLRPTTGRERAGQEMTRSEVAYRITVRAAPHGAPSRPKADQRFRDGPRIFKILAVSEKDASCRFLTCFAREEVVA